MVDSISIAVGLEGDDDVRKSLEDMVKSVDSVKDAAEELGAADATVQVKAEGADEAKAAIEGVKDAAKELDETDATLHIDTEGAEAAKEVPGLLDTVSQSATIVSGSIDALGLAFNRLGSRMTRTLGPLGVVARSLGPVGIAAGVVAGAFLKFGDSTADALNKLTVESAKLGLTAQQLDTLQKAFAKVGVAPDALASSLEKLQPLLGGGLMRVGDIVPPSVFAGLQQFIAKLESMPDGIARTKLAIDTLGEALGGQVIAGLQTGSISAQNFAAALGSVTPATQQQIVEAAKYQQAINSMNAAWTELKGSITPIATPVFALLTQEINNLKKDIRGLMENFLLAKAVFQVFKAGISGGDIGAAAKQAAEDYNKATQALQQTGQAAEQTGQEAAQAGQTAASGFMVWDEKLGAITQQQAALAQSSTQAGQEAAQAGQTAASGWDAFLQKLDEVARKIGTILSGGGGAAAPSQIPGNARGGFIGGRGTGTSDSNLAWVSRGEHIMPARVVRQPGVLSFLEALRRGGGIPGFAAGGQVGNIPSSLSGIAQSFIRAFDAIDAANKSNLRAMEDIARSVIRAGSSMDQSMLGIQNIMRPAIQALEDLIRAPGRRGGGLLGGRGTGTSDSNLAWLSRGEYVTPARAVAQPGVLAFLEALRRSGGNLRGVLDGMGRFALGGMVPRAMPAFAGGGMAGGGNHVTIQFPGLPPIGGLRASSAVVDELHRAAALAQVRSGGRKPSRYS